MKICVIFLYAFLFSFINLSNLIEYFIELILKGGHIFVSNTQ